MFNNHYKNIAEKTSGIAPERLGVSSLPENDEETIKKKKKKKKSSVILKITQVFQRFNVIKMTL